MKKITVITTKDTTIVSAAMLETYGDMEPTASVSTATFPERGALNAVYEAATEQVAALGPNDSAEIWVPNFVFQTMTKLVYAATFQDAKRGEQCYANLTPAQQKAFVEFKDLFCKFGSACIGRKVRVNDITNLYRFQLNGTPNRELKSGDVVEVEYPPKDDNKKIAVVAGMKVQGATSLTRCPHTIEKRGENYFITRMIRVGDKCETTISALRKFRSGEFVPERDNDIRLMNVLALAAIANSYLPKVAMFKGTVAANG